MGPIRPGAHQRHPHVPGGGRSWQSECGPFRSGLDRPGAARCAHPRGTGGPGGVDEGSVHERMLAKYPTPIRPAATRLTCGGSTASTSTPSAGWPGKNELKARKGSPSDGSHGFSSTLASLGWRRSTRKTRSRPRSVSGSRSNELGAEVCVTPLESLRGPPRPDPSRVADEVGAPRRVLPGISHLCTVTDEAWERATDFWAIVRRQGRFNTASPSGSGCRRYPRGGRRDLRPTWGYRHRRNDQYPPPWLVPRRSTPGSGKTFSEVRTQRATPGWVQEEMAPRGEIPLLTTQAD